jgi:hypothetical protein
MRKALLGVALALWLAPPAHAGRSRLLYTGNWTGHPEIYAIDPSGKAPVAQLTHWRGACPEPPYYLPVALHPSPNGRFLAVNCGAGLWLMRTDGQHTRVLVPVGEPRARRVVTVRWSPDSKLLGYDVGDDVRVIDPVTGRDHVATARDLSRLRWAEGLTSPDGFWAARVSTAATVVVRLRDGGTWTLPGAIDGAWSADSTRIALASPDGIRVADTRTRRVRLLTNDIGFGELHRSDEPTGLGVSWAPDGRTVAYVMGRDTYASASWTRLSGDLRTVTTSGRVRTLVRADRAYGGAMRAVAWVKAVRGYRYGPPDPYPADLVSPSGVLAGGPIERLAADGDRVAFLACEAIVVWTPAAGAIEPQESNRCFVPELTGRYYVYDLALAGDRLVYALNEGCMSIRISLNVRVVSPPGGETRIASSFGNCGGPFGTAYGRAAGSDDLLVFGEWTEGYSPQPPYPVRSAALRRVDGTSCPCPVLASTPGALYPADVDDSRVLAYGDNETLVIDRSGRRLLSLAVSPQAARLAGNDAVLLVHGQLRDYDVRDAALLHVWALPDVTSGLPCGWRLCFPQRLTLGDAARGLVAYVLDRQLHVLRLADGADAVVGQASLARFMDGGLVYADGARLRLVPFSQLPLRSF